MLFAKKEHFSIFIIFVWLTKNFLFKKTTTTKTSPNIYGSFSPCKISEQIQYIGENRSLEELTGFTIRITGLHKFPGHKCEKLSDFQDKGQFLLLPGHFQDPNGIPGHFQDFQDFQDGWPPWCVVCVLCVYVCTCIYLF